VNYKATAAAFACVAVKLLRTSVILIERNQPIMCMRVLCPAAYAGTLTNNADAMMLSDVCLSVAYMGSNWRIDRPKKTRIGIDIAYVTHDSDTTFKIKGQTTRFQRRGILRWPPLPPTTCFIMLPPLIGGEFKWLV